MHRTRLPREAPACSVWTDVSSVPPRDHDGPHPPPQAPTFKPYPMKTHLVLPFPVSYVGDCVRTAPYTHPDHARYGASARGAEADRRGASALRVWELASSARLRQHGGAFRGARTPRPLGARPGPAEGTEPPFGTHVLTPPGAAPLARADAPGNTLFPPGRQGHTARQ